MTVTFCFEYNTWIRTFFSSYYWFESIRNWSHFIQMHALAYREWFISNATWDRKKKIEKKRMLNDNIRDQQKKKKSFSNWRNSVRFENISIIIFNDCENIRKLINSFGRYAHFGAQKNKIHKQTMEYHVFSCLISRVSLVFIWNGVKSFVAPQMFRTEKGEWINWMERANAFRHIIIIWKFQSAAEWCFMLVKCYLIHPTPTLEDRNMTFLSDSSPIWPT